MMNPRLPDEASQADFQLQRRVQRYLLGRHLPSLRRVHVRVAGNTAVIDGTVPSYHAKQLATECCRRVAGIMHVRNDIQVI